MRKSSHQSDGLYDIVCVCVYVWVCESVYKLLEEKAKIFRWKKHKKYEETHKNFKSKHRCVLLIISRN